MLLKQRLFFNASFTTPLFSNFSKAKDFQVRSTSIKREALPSGLKGLHQRRSRSINGLAVQGEQES